MRLSGFAPVVGATALRICCVFYSFGYKIRNRKRNTVANLLRFFVLLAMKLVTLERNGVAENKTNSYLVRRRNSFPTVALRCKIVAHTKLVLTEGRLDVSLRIPPASFVFREGVALRPGWGEY